MTLDDGPCLASLNTFTCCSINEVCIINDYYEECVGNDIYNYSYFNVSRCESPDKDTNCTGTLCNDPTIFNLPKEVAIYPVTGQTVIIFENTTRYS